MYLVLSIGLGLIIERLFLAKLYLKVLISFILFGIVTLNIFQFWQFHKNILKHDTMTMKYYFAIFGKTKIPENAEKLLLINRSTTGVERFEHEEGYHKKIIGDLSFTRPDLTYPGRYIKDEKDTSNLCLVMDRSFIYSPGLAMKYKNITEEYYAWVRVSVEVRYPKFYSDIWPVLVITFDHKGVSYKYFGSDLICKEEEKGEWKKLSFDYMTPEIRNKNDKLKVYVWQRGRKPFYLKNLVVQAFEPIIN